MIGESFVAGALGYILGATPFGYLAGRLRGIDIRNHGSGNIGATNVLRVLGKPIGLAVFALDFAKGLVSVLAASWASGSEGVAAAAGLGVILGHNYTFWLGFKGGKGIATSAGVLCGLMPAAAAVGIATWTIVFATTRYVSLASIAAALSLPITLGAQMIVGRGSILLLCLSIVMAVLGVWRHRGNLERLRKGTEPRFEKKKSGESHAKNLAADERTADGES